MLHRQKLSVLLAATALAMAAPALGQRGSRIVRVEDRRPSVGAAADSSSFNALHLDKFFDERLDVDGHVFDVHWTPAEGGAPVGTVVRFEYRQQDPDEVHALEVAYPFRVTDRRRATFRITGEAFQEGGLVTAWRVRILEGGNVVAEQQSASWR